MSSLIRRWIEPQFDTSHHQITFLYWKWVASNQDTVQRVFMEDLKHPRLLPRVLIVLNTLKIKASCLSQHVHKSMKMEKLS